jgi:EmrB/QacA subfamily drug resistance transporter
VSTNTRPDASASAGLGLFVIGLACVLLPISLAGPSVALPSIGEALNANLTSLQWVINGYDLTFAACMLASGSLGDRLGRRKVFRAGIAVFSAAQLVAAIAPSMLILDLARSVAGIGAAGVLTCGVASLAVMFEDPAGRAKAFGVFGTAIGCGLAFGPFVCGALNTQLGWRAVFYVPAGIGLLVLIGSSVIRESRNPAGGRIDWAGTVIFTAALFALIFGLLQGPQLGWASGTVLSCLAVAVVLLIAFGLVERRVKDPMFDLSLLVQRRYAALCLAVTALVFGFTPLLVYLPVYYASVDGMTAQDSGLLLMMLTLPTLVMPMITGYLAKWVSVRVLVLATVVLTGAGIAWLTVIHPGAGLLVVLGPYLVIGIGIGVSFGVMDGAAVGAVDPGRAGMAAGMFNTVRLGGETIGIAVVGALLAGLTGSNLTGRMGGFDTPYADRPQDAANLVNQGDLAGVVGSVSRAGSRPAFQDLLAGAYTDALHVTLWALAALCTVSAVILLVLDRSDRAVGRQASAQPTEDAVSQI